MKINGALLKTWREQCTAAPALRAYITGAEWVELCKLAERGSDAYPALVQALSNLAGIVPSMMNAEVWIEYRRTARLLLAELGEAVITREGQDNAGFHAPPYLNIPTFLRRKPDAWKKGVAVTLNQPFNDFDWTPLYAKHEPGDAYVGGKVPPPIGDSFTSRTLAAKTKENDELKKVNSLLIDEIKRLEDLLYPLKVVD